MNLLKTLAKVSSITMFSRLLGFVRDAVIARYFGAGGATDAFFVAFKLPNLLRRIFAEGAFSQAFVPVLSEYKTNRSHEETVDFTRYVAGFLAFVLFWVTIAGILASSAIIWVSAPGFAKTPETFNLASDLLKITFPYIFFISLSSLASGILNTYNRFSVPAFTPAFLNVSFILFAIFLTDKFDPPVMTLAWAVLAGGALQLGWQLPFLWKLGFFKFPKIKFGDARVKRILLLMLPAVLGVSVSQLSLVINTIFASFLPEGSVSWLYYADRLMELPSGVLGAALGTILLPTLSKEASSKSQEEFSRVMEWGMKLVFVLTIPAAFGLATLSLPIIQTLFMYNEFTQEHAIQTSRALFAYSIGLVGIIMVKVLAPAFYAHQNIKTPVKIAVFSLVCTQLMNLAFIFPLKHVGLALSIGLAAVINAMLLYHLLKKHNIYKHEMRWLPFVGKILFSSILMAGVIVLILRQNAIPMDFARMRGATRLGWLFAIIGVGVVVYFASLRILGMRLRDFRKNVAA